MQEENYFPLDQGKVLKIEQDEDSFDLRTEIELKMGTERLVSKEGWFQRKTGFKGRKNVLN